MIVAMKVYTRRGDDGTTGLLYGGRVEKDDLRTEAYGTVDEAVSALGLARAALGDALGAAEWHDEVLARQRQLFVLGAQLATHLDHADRLADGVSRMTEEMVTGLEERIDELVERFPLPEAFVVPGASRAGAAIDLARTIVRRAERRVVVLQREGLLADDVPLRYLNRLSDELFVLARAVEEGAFTPTRDGAQE